MSPDAVVIAAAILVAGLFGAVIVAEKVSRAIRLVVDQVERIANTQRLGLESVQREESAKNQDRYLASRALKPTGHTGQFSPAMTGGGAGNSVVSLEGYAISGEATPAVFVTKAAKPAPARKRTGRAK